MANQSELDLRLDAAFGRRRALLEQRNVTAYRLFGGAADGIDGLFLDRYGPGAVLTLYEDAQIEPSSALASAVLDRIKPFGIEAVYIKPFVKDRSKLGGRHDAQLREATPAAGEPLPSSIVVREYSSQFEVCLYDGFSTGLFLDQRENRQWLATLGASRVLNTFAYTCAFAVPLACAGAHVTNVDVSQRYLDWGRRNLEHNELGEHSCRFVRIDTSRYLAYARRHALTFDLIILDPPTFSAGSSADKRAPWSAVQDFPRLLGEAVGLLAPGGHIFASTNAHELAAPGRLRAMVRAALGREPRWVEPPPPPVDFAHERGRFACACFTL